jgi:adenylate kinase
MVKSNRQRAALLFGPPGSGKGTQGRALATLPGFIHIACGDVFRKLDPTSPNGIQVRSFTDRGALVPDELTVAVWRDHVSCLRQHNGLDPAKDVLVLDGIPRTPRQAQLLDDDLEVLAIFHLILQVEDEAVQRIRQRALRENRVDDADEAVIRQRLATFRRETEQTLTFYNPSLVVPIDASQSPIYVLREIAEAFCRRMAGCAVAGTASPFAVSRSS